MDQINKICAKANDMEKKHLLMGDSKKASSSDSAFDSTIPVSNMNAKIFILIAAVACHTSAQSSPSFGFGVGGNTAGQTGGQTTGLSNNVGGFVPQISNPLGQNSGQNFGQNSGNMEGSVAPGQNLGQQGQGFQSGGQNENSQGQQISQQWQNMMEQYQQYFQQAAQSYGQYFQGIQQYYASMADRIQRWTAHFQRKSQFFRTMFQQIRDQAAQNGTATGQQVVNIANSYLFQAQALNGMYSPFLMMSTIQRLSQLASQGNPEAQQALITLGQAAFSAFMANQNGQGGMAQGQGVNQQVAGGTPAQIGAGIINAAEQAQPFNEFQVSS